ncbi:MAG: diaminopimelate decarboxylase [Gemmatimonadaceae bacterium]|nr:diaminopimelate decarboxylase [Gemmatimonadaceae bacterium]
MTDGFVRRDGTLWCEGVPLPLVAEQVGTPTYVYSASIIRQRVAWLSSALTDVPHRIHYALKANATHGVLQVLRDAGVGADVVSGGELHRARRAGFAPADIVFDGPGKTTGEIREAIAAGVKVLNIESMGEAVRIAETAAAMGRVADVGLRINPEVTVENFHEYISTGEAGDKFGIPYHDAMAVAAWVVAQPSLRLVGLHMHVGSMLYGFDAFGAAIEKLAVLIDRIREAHGSAAITMLDLGGGLPVAYADGDETANLDGYAETVRRAHARTGCTILLEPGRLLVAEAGVLLSRVLYRKRSGGREYVIVDAAMTELIRPSLYDAHHEITAVHERPGAMRADVVGPVCESGDFFAHDRDVAPVEPDDLVVLETAGAYGAVMSSNYNARPRAAEVLVDGDRFAVVRHRETYDDLVRLEDETPSWRPV